MEDLNQKEVIFFKIVENFPDAIFLVNLEGEVLYVNKKSISEFGYSPADMKGKKIQDFIFSENENNLPAYLKAGIFEKDGKDFFIKNKDGKDIKARVSVYVSDDGKDPSYNVVLVRDSAKGGLLSNETLMRSSNDLQEISQKLLSKNKDIEKKADELERMNKLMLDRELKMVELKKRIRDLEQGLQ